MMKRAVTAALLALAIVPCGAVLGKDPTIQIDCSKKVSDVSPMMYGLMTEEINYSYDGGLYGELIRNRNFKDTLAKPAHWSLEQAAGGRCAISLAVSEPFSEALPVSLKLDATSLTGDQEAKIVNEGYWGIPVRPNTTYKVSFYARGSMFGARGPLTVAIESNDRAEVLAKAEVPQLTTGWQQYNVTLTTGADVKESAGNHFSISTKSLGTYWFTQVSMFGPTYKDRWNGLRVDLMQKLVDMKPAFLRFPGGNFLEGDTVETRFDWKKTIGPVAERPGHASPWRYMSTDGMGLLEFLEWTEDMHAQPLLAVYAGYSLHQQSVKPGPALDAFVQEALDEIEYVTGDENTKWGAQRIKDGHPQPFPLTYVEIGNEDWFDRTGSYDGRFAQFYDAIRAKYPKLQLIATTKVKSRTPDLLDQHFYNSVPQSIQRSETYDKADRNGPKIFVGEWATREGEPTTNFNAALGDAAFLTGLERNADLVRMSCYAPLFVNVNPGGMQWRSDLIGYDALNSFGSPSYHMQKMFTTYLGDELVGSSIADVPTGEGGAKQLFYSVTRDSKKGTIYLKMVNASDTRVNVHLQVSGENLAPKGTAVVMTASDPEMTNSILDPVKIVPQTTAVEGVKGAFVQGVGPYSITVLVFDSAEGGGTPSANATGGK